MHAKRTNSNQKIHTEHHSAATHPCNPHADRRTRRLTIAQTSNLSTPGSLQTQIHSVQSIQADKTRPHLLNESHACPCEQLAGEKPPRPYPSNASEEVVEFRTISIRIVAISSSKSTITCFREPQARTRESMPSGNPVSDTLDAKFYDAKEKATPKAGYHEKQKDNVSSRAEGESVRLSSLE